MRKISILFLFLPVLLSCIPPIGEKELDLHHFKITVPKEWKYQKVQGEDSFVGNILTPHSIFTFDFSTHGYANSLIQTEKDYLDHGDWLQSCPFCKPGVTYTASFDVKSEKARQMKEKGINDSTLVHVEAAPDPEKIIHQADSLEKLKYPNADYIAKLSYKDSTIILPIIIPDRIKLHHILLDTTDQYIIKTIWPKNTGKGITAIYFQGRKNHLTFNLVGHNLTKTEQEQALNAFKTIKIPE